MKGIYPEMSVKDYRAADGLNYSLLADWMDTRSKKVRENKNFYEFGKAFESKLQDDFTRSNIFNKRFFITTAPGMMPDNLADWLEHGVDLSKKFTLLKSGKRSQDKRYKRLHAWLDDCIDNPGFVPISRLEEDMICIMIENLMEVKIYGHTVNELLSVAEFQVPIFWVKNGIQKKALLDLLIRAENNYPFDIKTSASLPQFKTFFRNKYYIQDLHYTEGVQSVLDESMPMKFLVASKEDPEFLAQPFGMDDSSRGWMIDRYQKACIECDEWIKGGMEPVGCKPYETIKVY